jgi:hypothetical protein
MVNGHLEHDRIVGIDPGCKISAVLLWNRKTRSIEDRKIVANEEVIAWLTFLPMADVAIESIRSYGQRVGIEIFDTCRWIGRFEQVAKDSGHMVYLYTRPDAKRHLFGNAGYRDPEVRRALVWEFGGRKRGEPLYGMKTHLWSALVMALYHDATHYSRTGKVLTKERPVSISPQI